MSKKLIDYNAQTATQTWHDYDEVNDVTTIAEIQDVEPSLELSKSFRNADISGGAGSTSDGLRLNQYSKEGIKNDMWHVADIPNSVIMKGKREKGVVIFNKHQWNEVKKLLNDPEWAYLRTGTGRV